MNAAQRKCIRDAANLFDVIAETAIKMGLYTRAAEARGHLAMCNALLSGDPVEIAWAKERLARGPMFSDILGDIFGDVIGGATQ